MHALALLAALAAPWGAPQTLSEPHEFVEAPHIAFTRDGGALASWTWQDGTRAGARAGASGAVRAAGADRFGGERSLARPERPARTATLAGVASDGRRVLVARVRHGRADRLEVAAWSAVTRVGRWRTVATGAQILRATLATNPGGDATLAWWDRGRGHPRLYAAVRRRGRGFARPVRLAASGFGDVGVAVGARGDVLVAWAAHDAVLTRAHGHRGLRFGPVRRASRGPAPGADVEAAVGADGRAAVAWAAQRVTEGGETGPIRYAAATRASGAARFGGEQRLERQPGVRLASPVRLAMDAAGRSTVAWAGLAGARVAVRVADTGSGLRFGAPGWASPPGAAFHARPAALAAGPGGRRLVVWTADATGDGTGPVLAAYAPPLAAFGAPETVTGAATARVPHAAFDPRTGRAEVVWSEGPAGAPRRVARAAARTG